MRTDKYGQIILSEGDLCDLYMRNSNRKIRKCYVDSTINFSSDLELPDIPVLIPYTDSGISIESFDKAAQTEWNIPDDYKNLDIAQWLLEQCNTDEERQRVGQELLLYLDRELFPLLQYLKFLVDTMRKYNIVWGVGRGSSVSSYVLYLIGVHKINSMFYDLDVHEFLR